MNSIVLFTILILILIDVFLAYELPTHLAYILATIFIVIELHISIINKVFIAVIIWFGLLVFHYLIWRRLIEKIHDQVIAPRKHTAGIEGLIGKKGVIKEVEGIKLLFVNEELYEFKNQTNRENIVGNSYEILHVESNKLII